MTTLTITVNKNGFGRSVTVLASRVILVEVLTALVLIGLGMIIGRGV